MAEKKEQQEQKAEKSQQSDVKHIIRVAQTDLKGHKKIVDALRKIKGVSFMFSNALCAAAGLDKDKLAGKMTEKEVEALNKVFDNPTEHLPKWMLNRRDDYETGENQHLIAGKLGFTQDNDVKRLKMIKSYRGMRHAWRLPVRGQRTKSNFRSNKKRGVKR